MSTGPTIIDVDDQQVISDVGPVRERLSRRFTLPLLIGILGLLMFGPLAFGGVEPWAVFTIEAGAALLLLAWTLAAAVSPMGLNVRFSPLINPMLLFLAVGMLQLILGRSAYAYNTNMELRLIIAYGVIAFLTVQALQRSDDFRKFGWVMAGFGFAVAVFAVAQDFAGNGKIYWLRTQHEAVIYGPYVNHSHFAGLMEMLAPFAAVLAGNRMLHGGKRALMVFAAAFMVGTLFMSRSLGGAVAISCQVIVFILLARREHRSARLERRRVLGIVAVAVLTLGFLAWLDQGRSLDRILGFRHPKYSASTTSRIAIAKDSLKMFTGRPVLGWGLGTFSLVYPKYQSYYSIFLINHAHNDYLEALTETGLVGLGAVIWFVVSLYRSSFQKLGDWSKQPRAGVRLAALVACTGILVHSLSDFNLHIPGNAALFFALSWVATTGAGARHPHTTDGHSAH
jgi:O-antigen ligase